jgi:hypothetical protein
MVFRMYETTNATKRGVSIPPPRLHWGWVVALGFVTAFLFYGVWLIVQSSWSRRARGKSVAFPMSIVLCAAQLGFLFAGPSQSRPIIWIFGFVISDKASALVAVFWLIAIILRIANLFILRSELMNEPISIHLSAPMTFFFGPIYFQYHLRDYQGAPLKELQGLGLSQPSQDTLRR